MLQLALIVMGLFIVFLFLRSEKKKHMPRNEIEKKAEIFKKEIIEFLNDVQRKTTKIKIRRLEREMEKFNKAKQLDRILEKAEEEKNPYKAIDYYLEAFSFITKHNFEVDRKREIEERIKYLQGRIESSTSNTSKI